MLVLKVEIKSICIYSLRGVGTPGAAQRALPPPNFFKRPKVPFFVMKSILFVQANVAANTKLTSKVPFLFSGNLDVFKKKLVKNVQFRYSTIRTFFFRPPFPRQHVREIFVGALFNIQKCRWNPVPPPNLLMLPTRLYSLDNFPNLPG